MDKKRLWRTIRLWTIPESSKRADYLRKKRVFASIGENVSIMDRKVPLYANLIRIGNNVHIASKVNLITHDITHVMLNRASKNAGGTVYQEKIGCIDIGDNVFVGSNTTILYDVRIGSNVIIGAGSLVNKDIPDNSVAAGVPAKVIGTFDAFVRKRRNEAEYPNGLKPIIGRCVPGALEKYCWDQFEAKRNR